MDKTDQRSKEIAQQLLTLENGIMGPKSQAYWSEVVSRETVVPTLRHLAEMCGKPEMRATIVQLWVSEQKQYDELIHQISIMEPKAMLSAIGDISIRDNNEFVAPYLDALAETNPETLHLALARMLYMGMYDYHRQGHSASLEAVARFDLNRVWDRAEGTLETAGPLHFFAWAIPENPNIPASRFEYTLSLLLGKGCDIDKINSTETAENYKSPLELLCRFHDESDVRKNYKEAIGLFIDRGADWRNIAQETSPLAWKFVQAHPTVRAWKNKVGLTEVAEKSRGQAPSESHEFKPRSGTPKM